MALLDLKDIGEAVEKLRRLRKELPEGENRAAMDHTLLRLGEHIVGIIGQDERLQSLTRAKTEARLHCPKPTQWASFQLEGKVATVIDMIIRGTTAATAWAQVLNAR